MTIKKKRVFVAGHQGMVGSALVRQLETHLNVTLVTRTRSELDLTQKKCVDEFFRDEGIDEIFLAAAKVGGIYANDNYPADFIYENLMIQANVVQGAFVAGVQKLLFLGSSCIYPRNAKQPMSETALLTGPLEPTNEPYAIAKIAGIKLCESFNRQYGKSHGVDYRSVMPNNLYGPGDNYHQENSHVIPALISRFHAAKTNRHKSVTIWGTGSPKREFLYVDDMAEACITVMNLSKEIYRENTEPMCSHINVGSGLDVSIKELAQIIKKITGFRGDIIYDPTKPDGSPRKIMDSARLLSFGWKPKLGLIEGLKKTYEQYRILCG